MFEPERAVRVAEIKDMRMSAIDDDVQVQINFYSALMSGRCGVKLIGSRLDALVATVPSTQPSTHLIQRKPEGPGSSCSEHID